MGGRLEEQRKNWALEHESLEKTQFVCLHSSEKDDHNEVWLATHAILFPVVSLWRKQVDPPYKGTGCLLFWIV